MPADEKSVNAGVLLEHSLCLLGKSFHILTVFQNRHPLTMFVGHNTIQAFQHLVTLDEESTAAQVVVRKDCAPYGMGVKYRAGLQLADYCEMEQGLRRCFALASPA